MATPVSGRFGSVAETDLVERLREALAHSQPGDKDVVVRSALAATGTGGNSAREVKDLTTAQTGVIGVRVVSKSNDATDGYGFLAVFYNTPPTGNMTASNLPADGFVVHIPFIDFSTAAGFAPIERERRFPSAKSFRYVAFVADGGVANTGLVDATATLIVDDSTATADSVVATTAVADA